MSEFWILKQTPWDLLSTHLPSQLTSHDYQTTLPLPTSLKASTIMSSLIRGLALLTGISAVVASPVERATCSTVWAGQTVTGTEVTSGVCRYTVKYGTADRWADSVAATTQK